MTAQNKLFNEDDMPSALGRLTSIDRHHDEKDIAGFLQEGNRALRNCKYALAMQLYCMYLLCRPGLAETIKLNFHLAKKRYIEQLEPENKAQVAVSGWALEHNAAGRAHTLATIYQRFARVDIIGCIRADVDNQLWEPIRSVDMPVHSLLLNNQPDLLFQAVGFVIDRPYALVHLSKPRMPNILLGLLYKWIWGAKILVDIDDEELAFVNAQAPLELAPMLEGQDAFPPFKHLGNKFWTQLSVGLVHEFDGVTVCNQALQTKYGGTIIRHARDENRFQPSAELSRHSREKYAIAQTDRVVLFFGTPRRHKGLLETAQAIAGLNNPAVLFVIVGDFPEASFKVELGKTPGARFHFLPNQPIENIPEILALADCCVLLQDEDSIAAQYQTPAKLTDALAMGVNVLITLTEGVRDLAGYAGFTTIKPGLLQQQLAGALSKAAAEDRRNSLPRQLYETFLSIAANQEALHSVSLKDWQPHLYQPLPAPVLAPGPCPDTTADHKASRPSGYFVGLNHELIAWEEQGNQARSDALVSIVIPIYNQLELTQACLESIASARTHTDYEIICVNNGSDKQVQAWLDEVSAGRQNIRHIKNPENYNFALGCNIGFAESAGSVVVFLNNDTEVTDDWLDELVKPLRNDTVVAVQPKLLYPDNSIQNIGIVFSGRHSFGYPVYAGLDSAEPVTQISRAYQAVTAACVAIRASDFAAVQGFDPMFINGMEDVDLCLRLTCNNSKTCYYQADSVVIHHESKTEGRRDNIDINRINFRNRWHDRIVADDFGYYQTDGFVVADWTRDREDRYASGIAIERPVLNKLKAGDC